MSPTTGTHVGRETLRKELSVLKKQLRQLKSVQTEVVRAEHRTRQAAEEWRRTFDSIGDMVAIIGPDHTFQRVNKALADFFRTTPKELLGKSCCRLFHGRTTPPKDCPCRKTLKTGKPARWRFFEPHLDMHFEFSTSPVRAPSGEVTGCVHIARNITASVQRDQEHTRLASQVQQAQKLESLGILAGGIAHDFNNMLMVIFGHAEIALLDMEKNAPSRRNVGEILKAGKRAAELCKQLLVYSGKGSFSREPLDLSRLVLEMGQLLEVTIGKNATLQYNLSGRLPPILGDATQVRQVVMNFITNASEAIGEAGGTITISTGSMNCTRKYLQSAILGKTLPRGRYVYLRVDDTGCGMDSETRTKIFDPFFSTKFTGRGLGLAAVLGIVRGHHGGLVLDTTPDRGSTFTVLLPRSAATKEARAREQKRKPLRLSGTVLLVDDEKGVRVVAKSILNRLGLDVMTARDGHEAMGIFRKHRRKIRLVLLDLQMPRLSGKETFRRLRGLSKKIPIILSSGYDEKDAASTLADEPHSAFIHKPYEITSLKDKITEVLARSKP